jgi:hypothetical protein
MLDTQLISTVVVTGVATDVVVAADDAITDTGTTELTVVAVVADVTAVDSSLM